jgi:hypothetical protein
MKQIAFVAAFFFLSSAFAADFKWGGRYRFEGVGVRNTNLQNGGTSKAYGLQHLILQPTIIAADGFNIYGRFDVLNNSSAGLLNSQVGQFLGSGPGSGTRTDATNSNVVSQTQNSDTLLINHLYISWVNEFNTLMVGRMPVHFGLGITHNDGAGEFDHWMDTKDIVGYKMVFGNLFLMPMLGKVNEGALQQEDDVNDYMLHFQYDNTESKLSMGVFYEARVAAGGASGGNDAPASMSGAGTTTDGWEGKQLNLFVSRRFDDSLGFGMEAGFQSGSTGLNQGGAIMSLQGFGIATELKWTPSNSKWSGLLKAGVATGDDPTTTDKFEGYIFDRNYDVSNLLFNHVLGNYDLFGSSIAGKASAVGAGSGSVDVDALSNVLYVSPSFSYKMSDLWSVDNRFTWASLQQTNFGTFSADKNVGIEWDLGLSYRPHEHFILGIDLAFLLPGDAFVGGASNFSKENAYGFGTKAAVSF